jgi:hypothetical protein
MSYVRRLAVLSTTLGLTAASLVTAASTSTASVARGDGSGSAVNVFVAANHSIDIDSELRPGLHKFVVRSAGEAGFQLGMPAPGYTKRELVRDIVAGLNQGKVRALKRFEANMTLLGGVSSTADEQGTMWVNLQRGTYWAIDTMPGRPQASEIETIRVSGERLGARADAGTVIRAVGEVDWARRPASMPARGKVTFRNASTDNHFLGLTKLAKGKTMADFREWIEGVAQGVEGPPPVNFNVGTETGVVSPGKSMTMRYSLPPGNYVMICFWPDADMGGMPHAFMGMYRGIRIG